MTLTSVLDVLRAISGYRELPELFAALVKALRPVVPADWHVMTLRRGREGELFNAYSEPTIGEFSNRLRDWLPPDIMQEPHVADDARALRLYESDAVNPPILYDLWQRHGVRSSLRIPLVVEGALVGAVSGWSRDPHGFDNINLDVATELGMAISVVVDSCLAYEHLAQLRDEADDDHSYLLDALAMVRATEDGLIGRGAAFSTVRQQIEVVAPTDAPVLLTGESGTGKDVVARAIHAASSRRDRPLVTVNCAAIPANLAESELFGHEEGAFTGATKPRVGRFEQANGCTLFLDEVGELSLPVQAKLLRVLQERELERVGSTESLKIDVRIIAATNRDLPELIKADRFREDLYFRLAVFPIRLPPLRSRLEDLPALVERFVKTAAERFRVPVRRVTPDAIRRLTDHDWPGNVRELQHAIERAMIISPGRELSLDAIVPRRLAPISSGSDSEPLRREYLAALESTRWVIEGTDG
ncbi:MAG TPA: sigma 54-interacting transcriptional regulator, partial [Kofleriaceae bacterium]|nr:sigma 54-interacting transcriptional regulator [Kofleriaceae bacterium]